jgi:hypothetical protein
MNFLNLKKILFFTPLLFLTVLLNGCLFNSTVTESTRVISVNFYSDNCLDCNDLKGKLIRMSFKFTLSPIVFLTYDKTSDKTKVDSEEKLKQAGIINEAHRDDGLRYAILYNAKTKEKLAQIDALDNETIIEDKIKNAIESVK